MAKQLPKACQTAVPNLQIQSESTKLNHMPGFVVNDTRREAAPNIAAAGLFQRLTLPHAATAVMEMGCRRPVCFSIICLMWLRFTKADWNQATFDNAPLARGFSHFHCLVAVRAQWQQKHSGSIRQSLEVAPPFSRGQSEHWGQQLYTVVQSNTTLDTHILHQPVSLHCPHLRATLLATNQLNVHTTETTSDP